MHVKGSSAIFEDCFLDSPRVLLAVMSWQIGKEMANNQCLLSLSHGAAAADGSLRRLLCLFFRHSAGGNDRVIQCMLLPSALCVYLHLPGHPEDRLQPPEADLPSEASRFQDG